MTATIIPIRRPNRRYCWDCENGYSGSDGCYCAVFREFIDNEAIATDCEHYEAETPVPTAPKKRPTKRPASEQMVSIVNGDYLQVMGDPIAPTFVTVSSPAVASPWSPTHDQTVAYIRSLHTTLWGKQVIVAKEDDLHRAADWVVQLFAALKEHSGA